MPSLPVYAEQRHPRGLSHWLPLLLPGLLALLGATYPRILLRCLKICAGPAFLALAWWCIPRKTPGGMRLRLSGTNTVPMPFVAGILLCAAGLLLGMARGLAWEGRILQVSQLARAGTPEELVLIPLEEPRPEYGSRYSFRALAYPPGLEGHSWFGVEARVYTSDASKFAPGLTVYCRAALELPASAMNPGGFDYRGYLLGERILALAMVESVLERRGGESGPSRSLPPWTLLRCLTARGLAALVGRMSRAIESGFPEEDAAVLKAVFLGVRSGLFPEESRDFRRSGFYRFVGLCGFHVDLLFGLVERGVRRLTKRPSFSRLAALLVAWVYGSVSGWPAGVTRAFVCGSLRSFAPALRRRYHPLAGLGASALVVAWTLPFPLKNIGCILTFAGSMGAWLGSVYEDVLKARHEASHPLRAAPVRSLTACVALLPVMAAHFEEVSIVSFALSGLWGSLASVMVPAAALVSFVPLLGAAFGWIPHVLLKGARAIAALSARAPLSSVCLPAPGCLEVAACWTLLAVPLASSGILGRIRWGEDADFYYRRNMRLRALRMAGVLGSAAVLLVSAFCRVYAVFPEVTFLYVGQGDCAVVRCGRSVMIVDTGTASAFERHVLPYLRARGIRRVDLCVISHLHEDHAGGLAALCAGSTVGAVAVTPGFREDAEAMIAGDGKGQGNSMPRVVEVAAGSTYRWAGAVLDVLLPEQGRYSTDEIANESSLAFVLKVGKMEVEFWGDAPAKSISDVLDRFSGALTGEAGGKQVVVKVPHHGSPDAYVESLYVRPYGEVVSVISVGANPYGHPSKLVVEAASRGGKTLRLDEKGAVTVRSVLGRTVVRTFLP